MPKTGSEVVVVDFHPTVASQKSATDHEKRHVVPVARMASRCRIYKHAFFETSLASDPVLGSSERLVGSVSRNAFACHRSQQVRQSEGSLRANRPSVRPKTVIPAVRHAAERSCRTNAISWPSGKSFSMTAVSPTVAWTCGNATVSWFWCLHC